MTPMRRRRGRGRRRRGRRRGGRLWRRRLWWIAGLVVLSVALLALIAGPEEVGRVASDAWDGVRGGMVCEAEGGEARVTNAGAYHSQLKSKARPYILNNVAVGAALMYGRGASMETRGFEVVDAPTLLPLAGEVDVVLMYQGRVGDLPWEDVKSRLTFSVSADPPSCSVDEVVGGW